MNKTLNTRIGDIEKRLKAIQKFLMPNDRNGRNQMVEIIALCVSGTLSIGVGIYHLARLLIQLHIA